MRTGLMVSIIVLFLVGCGSHQPPLQSVEKVDVKRYMGRWYEIARYEHSFEVGCQNVTAEYTLLEDGRIDVRNLCKRVDEGISEAHGKAYAVDESNARLKVTFYWPFYGDYWILMLDDAYQYALVGAPSREYLWILSRTKRIDEKRREAILSTLPGFGYEAERLIWTIQE